MTCVVLGDSIALGVGHALTECSTRAVVGISAAAFVRRFPCVQSNIVIISLGSNPSPKDEESLRAVRRCHSGRVTWLLPPARARALIAKIAAEYGDRVVDVRDAGATADRIHPSSAGYAQLAKEVAQ